MSGRTTPWRRTSLRTRLVLSLLLVLAVALTLTGLTASAVLRSYLAGRIDDEMVRTVASVRNGPLAGPFRGPRQRQQLPSRYVVRVLAADGTLVADLLEPLGADLPPDLSGVTQADATERAGAPYTIDNAEGTPWRVLLTPLGRGQTFVLATSLDDVDATTSRLRRIVLLVDLVALLLGAFVGLAAVRGSLRPLVRIEETAGAIARGDLSRRVPEEGGTQTEVGRLSLALNGMLSQLEIAFAARAASEERMRRFMADASHELRTPLTSIRGFAELYRQGAVTGPDQLDRLMGRIEDESNRMAGLVEDLLLLASLDEKRPLRRDVVDLVVLAADAVHDARASAPDHTLLIELPGGGTGEGVLVGGDEERLRQVLMNLVVNAVRHTPAGTTVVVRAFPDAGTGVLEVSDDGPGLPQTSSGSVFDGFTRPDPARGRVNGGGAGLGLTIVTALVHAHGGEIEVESAPGAGATFRVRLPLSPG